MNRAVKLFFIVLSLAMSVAIIGCGRKSGAGNNNINQSRSPGAEQSSLSAPNVNTGQPPQTAAGDNLTNQAQAGEQPASSQPLPGASTTRKMPSFIDEQTGTIKDIPYYPYGQITNTYYGPQEGVGNAMRVTMDTADSLEKIQAFYEKATRSKGWTIVSKVNNGEQADLMLNKGDKDDAAIMAKKDNNTGRVVLVIVRTEKSPASQQ